MSAYIADRDALERVAYEFIASEVGDDLPGMTDQARRLADALIASGRIIDAATLADDQPLVYRAARWLYAAYDEDPDKDWPDESEHARTTWSNDARDAFRALAAALTERTR